MNERQNGRKIERIIQPKKQQRPHFLFTGPDNGEPVYCYSIDEEREQVVELHHIPIEILTMLSIWIDRLMEFNGGHGEITFKIVGGQFKSASATETFRFKKERPEA